MDSTAQKQQGSMIGRYQLVQIIGHGGMGEVWQATDTHLGRQVALKLLPALPAEKRDYLDDFVTEMRATAMLEHPHILTLHDFGEQRMDNGLIVPYLVMPYVTGGTLRRRMQSARGMLAVQLSLSFLRQAALAIDYAHSKQVLHRDIKPENMLLQQDWLLLADFGLAKILSSTSVHEKTHAQSGTPVYMAPERVHGQIAPSSDLYSLAVIAYELFTDQPPFRGRNHYQIFVQHVQTPPPAPRELNASIPEEVSRVLLQGLAKQPLERPASCIAFVDALQQGWESIAPSLNDVDETLLGPRSKRWQQLAQTSSASLDASFSTPLAPSPTPMDTVAFSHSDLSPAFVAQSTPVSPANNYDQPSHQSDERPEHDSRRTTDISAEDTPSLPLQTVPLKMSRRKALINVVSTTGLAMAGLAAVALLYKPSLPVHPPLPGPHQLISGRPVLSLNGHKDAVWVAKWDPSGRYLATASKDENLMLWDITTALHNAHSLQTLTQPVRTWNVAGVKFENTNGSVCWSPDGRKLIVPQMFGDKIYVLDIAAKTTVPTVYSDQPGINTGTDPIYDEICPGPLANHFTIASENFVHVWRIGQTNAAEKMFYCDKSLDLNITKMNWSHNGSILAAIAAGDDDHLRAALWHNDKPTPQIINLPARGTHFTFFRLVDTVAWSPVDPNLLLFSNADIAVVADLKKHLLVLAVGVLHNASTPVISGMSWSPNGRYIASSYGPLGDNNKATTPNPSIYIWDTIPLMKKAASKANTVDVQAPTLSFLAQQGSLGHTDTIIDVQWSPDGRYLATASMDHKVIIWQVDGA